MERKIGHAEDVRNELERSHIASHLKESHPQAWAELGVLNDGWKHFRLDIVKTHMTAFRRQLREAATLAREPGNGLYNLKE